MGRRNKSPKKTKIRIANAETNGDSYDNGEPPGDSFERMVIAEASEKGSRFKVDGPKDGSLAHKYKDRALEIYECLIQSPLKESRNMAALHASTSSRRSGPARVLREDFCSSAAMCQAWLSESILRKAVACDNDESMIKAAETLSLEEGRTYLVVDQEKEPEYRRRQVGDGSPRIILLRSSVLEPDPQLADKSFPFLADVVCGLNFSVNYLTRRGELLKYLRLSKERLKRGGVFIMDEFCGEDLSLRTSQMSHGHQHDGTSKRERERGVSIPPYQYKRSGLFEGHWVEYYSSQTQLDLMSNRIRLTLTFRFAKDGSWLKDVFSYTFRVWSIAEILEAMHEAGFDRTCVYISPRSETSEEHGNGCAENESLSDHSDGVSDTVDQSEPEYVIPEDSSTEYDPREPIETFKRVDGPISQTGPMLAYIVGCID